MKSRRTSQKRQAPQAVSGPTAEALDPVLEVFKRDLDLTLMEKNLRLTTEQRAQQLVNATRFIGRFRPLVRGSKH